MPERKPRHLSVEWVVPILAVFVVVAVGIAVLALVSRPSTVALRGDVASLRGQVSALQTNLAAEHQALVKAQSKLNALQRSATKTASSGTVAGLSTTVDRLSARLRALQVCVPQLQEQFDGLTLRTTNVNGWLTGSYLAKPAVVSASCAATLTGAAGQ